MADCDLSRYRIMASYVLMTFSRSQLVVSQLAIHITMITMIKLSKVILKRPFNSKYKQHLVTNIWFSDVVS